MGGSTTTTITPAPPSAEEDAYYASQQALAAKQLDVLNSTDNFNQDYLSQIAPLLDQQTQLMSQSVTDQGNYLQALQPAAQAQADALTASTQQQAEYLKDLQPSLDAQTALLQQQLAQQTAAANDPVQQQITKNQNDLVNSQLQAQLTDAPLQTQLLQQQLNQALNGNAATPQQSALIDQATNDALSTGNSQISSFANDALTQLRQNLAPTLGLRPTDTPILDRGDLVEKAAVQQQGQLASSLDQANANAKLNYPLAAGQLSDAVTTSAGQLGLATQDFQNQLSQTAANNRLQLLNATNNSYGIGMAGGGIAGVNSPLAIALNGGGLPGTAGAISTGLNSGIGLANASNENPLSFAQGSSTTASNTPGFTDILNAIGNAGQGIGAIMTKSDVRSKYNIDTDHYDNAGHRWVRFTYKGEPPSTRHIGVIAQEVEKTDPAAVMTDGHGVKFVNYKRLSRRAA